MHAADLDRITPTRRPDGRRVSGHQTWKDLLFAHWTFDPAVVRALVPPALDLDPWDGRAYVGLVPFEMRDVRLAPIPERLGLDFLETNLRTYVSFRGAPGVYFFSLEASSWLAVKAARWGWGLPYHHATMSVAEPSPGAMAYTSTRASRPSADLAVAYHLGEALGPSAPGSLEHFLLERYYLFSERRGHVWQGQVHHTPYPARRATVTSIAQGLVAAAGIPCARDAPPEVAHWSPGVSVEVFGPWRVS
jgi:uncharacterized protein YqjF (DUF2071 family)